MINKLTKEQESRIPEFREKWLNIGLRTGRASRQAAEMACRDAYAIAGLPPPRAFIWVDSPASGLIAAKLVKEFFKKYPAGDGDTKKVRGQVRDQVWDQVRGQVRDQVWGQVRGQVGDQVRDQVWGQVGGQVGDQVRGQVRDQVRGQVRGQVGDQVRDQVWGQVGDQVGGQVWDQVGDQVWGQVGDQVWGQVGDQVWGQVWGQVGDQVGDQVRDQVGDQVRGQVRGQVWDQVRGQVGDQVGENLSSLREEWNELGFWGQHDVGWLSFYDFFKEVCGLKCCEKLEPLMRVAQEVGWTWLYGGFVIFSERPSELYRNAKHDLHNETGPAVKYADGYAVYALNGIRVSREVVETPPEKFTKEMVLAGENVDIRREILRKIGIDNFLKKVGGKILHAHKDYELVEVDFKDGKLRRGLKMQNPSIDAVHFERVADDCKTVQEALAWRNQLSVYSEPLALT